MSRTIGLRKAYQLAQGLDTKHENMYDDFGYPTDITPEMLQEAPQRRPILFSAINKLTQKCFSNMPEIIEQGGDDKANTVFEVETTQFVAKHFSSLKESFFRALINEYSALLIVTADNKDLDEPLESIGTLEQIIELKPLWQSELTITEWYKDESDVSKFNTPMIFQFTQETELGQEPQTVDIHESRLLIVSERGLNSGYSRTIVALNAIIDAEKVRGASAEGSFKNSARHLNINVEDGISSLIRGSSATNEKEAMDSINDQVKLVNTGFDGAMITGKADVSVLSTSVPDPHSTWMIATAEVAMTFDLPQTVLIGQITGRLASEEDKIMFALSAEGYREVFINKKIVLQLLNKMSDAGAIEDKRYNIKWQSLVEISDSQKTEKANALATLNKMMLESGMRPAFTEDEIRIAAGYEPIGGEKIATEGNDDN